jgi:hypothetical protein
MVVFAEVGSILIPKANASHSSPKDYQTLMYLSYLIQNYTLSVISSWMWNLASDITGRLEVRCSRAGGCREVHSKGASRFLLFTKYHIYRYTCMQYLGTSGGAHILRNAKKTQKRKLLGRPKHG